MADCELQVLNLRKSKNGNALLGEPKWT